MRLWCDHFATTKTYNCKEVSKVSERFIEVFTRSPIGCRTNLIASSLLSKHKRLATTDLVAHRFQWSLWGREAVLVSSQIGFRLYGNRFCLEKGGYSLQPSGYLPVTDQPWGSDWLALHQRPVTDWLQSVLIIRQRVCDISPTCLRIIASFVTSTYSQSTHQRFNFLLFNHYHFCQ